MLLIALFKKGYYRWRSDKVLFLFYSLLPKKDKNPLFLKNWRPISLLNCDYKIASIAIGNRIKRVLPKIINGDQSGFLKGCSIAENIFLIDGIINYAKPGNMNKPGLLMFIDFEKAFDSIMWAFIERAHNYFNFGPSLVNWFRLFYNQVSSAIQNLSLIHIWRCRRRG